MSYYKYPWKTKKEEKLPIKKSGNKLTQSDFYSDMMIEIKNPFRHGDN